MISYTASKSVEGKKDNKESSINTLEGRKLEKRIKE